MRFTPASHGLRRPFRLQKINYVVFIFDPEDVLYLYSIVLYWCFLLVFARFAWRGPRVLFFSCLFHFLARNYYCDGTRSRSAMKPWCLLLQRLCQFSLGNLIMVSFHSTLYSSKFAWLTRRAFGFLNWSVNAWWKPNNKGKAGLITYCELNGK